MSRRTTTTSPQQNSSSSNPSTTTISRSSPSKSIPRPAALSTLRALQLADYITLLNGFSGVMSILHSLRFCVAPASFPQSIIFALGFIPLGLFFDFMDGKVARWRGKGEGSALGQELDSLADLVSFGVAPAAAAFALGMRTGLDMLGLTFFVLCGLLRLARFNVTVGEIPKDAKGKSLYFEGLPIPTSLSIVAAMAVAVVKGWVGRDLPLGVLGKGEWWEVHGVAAVFVAWGCLMLSRRVRVPKP